MGFIGLNSKSKLVTLGRISAVDVVFKHVRIYLKQMMIYAFCKYYRGCMHYRYVKLDIFFSLCLHIPDESEKIISFLGHALSGG